MCQVFWMFLGLAECKFDVGRVEYGLTLMLTTPERPGNLRMNSGAGFLYDGSWTSTNHMCYSKWLIIKFLNVACAWTNNERRSSNSTISTKPGGHLSMRPACFGHGLHDFYKCRNVGSMDFNRNGPLLRSRWSMTWRCRKLTFQH